MILGSAVYQYTLLSRLSVQDTQETDLLLRQDGQVCVASSTGERTRMESLAVPLLALSENKAFDDYVESFVFEGRMYVVFKEEGSGQVLTPAQLGREPLALRLTCLRALLSRMVVQSIPLSLACLLIEQGGVRFTAQGETVWSYRLPLARLCETGDGKKLFLLLGHLMEDVLGDVAFAPLQAYLQALALLEIQEIHEAFTRFAALSRQMEQLCITQETKQSLAARLRRRAQGLKGMGTRIVVYVVLVAEVVTVGYLAYSALFSVQRVDNGISQIGTVEIYEAGAP